MITYSLSFVTLSHSLVMSDEGYVVCSHNAGYSLHREKREICQKFYLLHREFENFAKTQNLVWSSCKLPDSTDKRYFAICREKFQLKQKKFDKSAKSVTNSINWHRGNLR